MIYTLCLDTRLRSTADELGNEYDLDCKNQKAISAIMHNQYTYI